MGATGCALSQDTLTLNIARFVEAMAEGVLMATRVTRRNKAVISGGVHPHYLGTVETYVQSLGTGKGSLVLMPVSASGAPDVDALIAAIIDEAALKIEKA